MAPKGNAKAKTPQPSKNKKGTPMKATPKSAPPKKKKPMFEVEEEEDSDLDVQQAVDQLLATSKVLKGKKKTPNGKAAVKKTEEEEDEEMDSDDADYLSAEDAEEGSDDGDDDDVEDEEDDDDEEDAEDDEDEDDDDEEEEKEEPAPKTKKSKKKGPKPEIKGVVVDNVNLGDSEAAKKERDRRTLFIKNIHPTTTEEEIKALSADIQVIKYPSYRQKGRSRGFALLEFKTEKVAEKNFSKFEGLELKKRVLVVDYVGEKSKNKKAADSKALPELINPLKLFMTGYPDSTPEETIKALFPEASQIDIPKRKKDDKLLGFTFIHFKDADQAKAAAEAMKSTKIGGKLPILQFAKLKQKPEAQKRSASDSDGSKKKAKKIKKEVKEEVEDDDEDDDDEDDDEGDDEEGDEDEEDDEEDGDEEDDDEDDDDEDEDDAE